MNPNESDRNHCYHPPHPRRVRVIVLIPEDDEADPDETPTETILDGIRQGLHEALTGKTIPLSQMWEGIDAD
jgi:hypothetical protein